ncbi:alanine racemase [Tianweitania sediminis]|uniref:alanine racemase n=1 Tax=Tianweitania sediminis TaxID=1502156 RepID=UPI00360BC3D4
MSAPFPPPSGSSVDARLAGGELVINLEALQSNYRRLAEAAPTAATAAVVKADAYGLGVDVVVPALLSAGCDTFFVAMLHEALAVRALAPEARIFVLNGLFGNDTAQTFVEAQLIPVLNTARDVAVWEAHGRAGGEPLPCALHVDTGMNRLGMNLEQAVALARENALTRALNIVLVMSHLACADLPEHPHNAHQAKCFALLRDAFPGVEASLANTSGILLGQAYHLSLTRPGIGLYGGVVLPGLVLEPVVTLTARILQLRDAAAGEAVSYGAATRLRRYSRLAVVAIGYADGFPRASSGSGVPLRELQPIGGYGFLHGHAVPILGRVTMDLTIFDVTDLAADLVRENDMIELIGPNIRLGDLAEASGTIGYEILTRLGRRFHRRVLGAV